MKFLLVTLPLLLFCQQLIAQRGGRYRSAQSDARVYQPPVITGKIIRVEITNADTLPVYLRFGPWKSIHTTDTVALVRYYSCQQNRQYTYYELDYFVSQENNCLLWYTLQKVNPGDTVRLFCKLKDLTDTETSKLYIRYLKDLGSLQFIASQLNDPNKIVQLRESIEFKQIYIDIPETQAGVEDKSILAVL